MLSVGVVPPVLDPVAGPSVAPFVAYLKIDGIEGESTDASHPGWITVLGYSESVSRPGQVVSSGAPTGKPSFSDFHFIKVVDKVTPTLLLSTASGKHYKEAILEVAHPDGALLDYKLSDVLVTSVRDSGGFDGESIPQENFSLNFSKVQWSFTPADPTQSAVTTGWNLKTNRAVASGVGGSNGGELVAPSVAAFGQIGASAFLKFDGIDGFSSDPSHKGWIDVLGYSTGLSRSGVGAGRLSFSDLSIVKKVDALTPALALGSASGKRLKSAILEVVESDGSVLDYKLSDVLVRAIGGNGASGDSAPLEQISLNFGKVQWDYTSRDPAGTPSTGAWDLKAHKSQASDVSFADLASFVGSQQSAGGEVGLTAFLKIEGVDGESQDKDHKDWIEILSYSWGLSQPASAMGAGAGAGRAKFSGFDVVKTIDNASPILMLNAASGKHFKSALLQIVAPDGSRHDHKLSDVVIRAVDNGGGDTVPHESLSLNFAKIEWASTPAGQSTPSAIASWDLKGHKSQISPASFADLPPAAAPQTSPDGPGFTAFLKMDSVDGASQDTDHKDWIEIHSFSWGLSQHNTTTGGGAGAGKVRFSDFNILKTIDKASPILMLDAAAGKHIKSAILEIVQPDGSLVDYKLSDVVIRAASDRGGGDAVPQESLSLNFSKVQWDYTANRGGVLQAPVSAAWDLKARKSSFVPAADPGFGPQRSSQGSAPLTAFLKLDGVEGTSRDESHQGWIDVLSFSWGVSQKSAGAGGGGGAGKASFSDFSVVKAVDKATPDLLLNLTGGTRIKGAILEVVQPDGSLADYKLSDVFIRSVNQSGVGGSAAPLEQFLLNYGKIQWDYVPASDDGSVPKPVTATWDLKSHKASFFAADRADLVAAVASQPPPGELGPFTAFLKLDGIDGTSRDETHQGWIDVLSFSWGLSQTNSSGGGGAGKVRSSGFDVVKTTDKATPLLMLHVASGKHFKSAVLEIVQPDGSLLDYKLSDVVIRSVADRGDADSDGLLERVSLSFGKIDWKTPTVAAERAIQSVARARVAAAAALSAVTDRRTTVDSLWADAGVSWLTNSS